MQKSFTELIQSACCAAAAGPAGPFLFFGENVGGTSVARRSEAKEAVSR